MQAKYLLDAGASVDVVKMSDAMTVLHWAAHHGNQELVHELLMHQKKKEKEREKEKKQNPTQPQKPALKLAYLLDKDHRTPIDIAGLQYEKKWSEEDDALRGDSLISDKSQVSSMNDFAATIRNLSNPSLLPNDPTNDYWHRCLFWCAAIGHRTGVEDALRRGGKPRWQVHRHIENLAATMHCSPLTVVVVFSICSILLLGSMNVLWFVSFPCSGSTLFRPIKHPCMLLSNMATRCPSFCFC
jgi:ankyrin repeat protein